MRPNVSPGALGTLLGTCGTGLAMALPEYKWIGWAIIALGVAVFVFQVRVENGAITAHWPRRETMWPVVGMAASVLAFAIFGIWYLQVRAANPIGSSSDNQFVADANFELPQKQLNTLGKALSNAELYIGIQYRYEYATVIWIEKGLRFYILPDQPPQKWEVHHEISTPENRELWNEEYLKRLFPETPRGKLPPASGIAKLWLENRPYWNKRVGFLEWENNLVGLHLQLFDKGLVMAPILNNRKLTTE